MYLREADAEVKAVFSYALLLVFYPLYFFLQGAKPGLVITAVEVFVLVEVLLVEVLDQLLETQNHPVHLLLVKTAVLLHKELGILQGVLDGLGHVQNPVNVHSVLSEYREFDRFEQLDYLVDKAFLLVDLVYRLLGLLDAFHQTQKLIQGLYRSAEALNLYFGLLQNSLYFVLGELVKMLHYELL